MRFNASVIGYTDKSISEDKGQIEDRRLKIETTKPAHLSGLCVCSKRTNMVRPSGLEPPTPTMSR